MQWFDNFLKTCENMNSVTCYKESGFPLLPEITIKNEHNKVVVRKVPVDGEFAKFGVKEGDVIESVNGISFHGFDNNKVFSTLSVMTGDMNIVFQTVVKKGKLQYNDCMHVLIIFSFRTSDQKQAKTESWQDGRGACC